MSDHHNNILTFQLSDHMRRIPQFDFSIATIQICRRRIRRLLMVSNDGSTAIINQTDYPPIISQLRIRRPALFHRRSLQQLTPHMLSTLHFCPEVLQQVVRRISRYLRDTTQRAIDSLRNSLEISVQVEDVLVVPIREDDVINGVLRDSMENIGFGAIPAPKTSIDALQTEAFNGRDCGGDCSICLNELQAGVNVIKLQCDHVFHADCIKQWLKQSNSCPLCRVKI